MSKHVICHVYAIQQYDGVFTVGAN